MLQQRAYPSIIQSWGIMGVVILSMIVFSPVQLYLSDLIGKELTLLVYYVITMSASFLFAHYIRKKETDISNYNIRAISPKIAIIVGVGVIGLQLGVLSPITSLIPIPDFFKRVFLEMGEMKGVFAFMTMVIAAPVFEELIFRGVILDGLLKRYTPAKSIFISSLLFGIVHLNPWQFIAAFGIGLFMGWVYYKTNNLSLCILVHFVNNLVAFVSTQFVSLEEELEKTFVESYGGVLNASLIISGGIIVFLICFWLLKKDFKKFDVVKE